MHLRMWMYDIAREQSPTLDHLRRFCDLTREAGYNAIGLYFEHRFAYPSAPWVHGKGVVMPEMIGKLQEEYVDLQIVPFINLLGHFEGFLYAEEGFQYAEERFKGMQACPSNPAFVDFAKGLIDDTIQIFTSKLIHIGGDETWQLGQCPKCSARVAEAEKKEGVDGKARLYGEHFGPLAQHVVDNGRRPGVWGDMYLDHRQALEHMPKHTLIFDWQYFGGCKESTRKFKDKGFEVVGCPAIQTYDAAWCHLLQSEENVREVIRDVEELDAYGVCLTTWECGLFGAYDTITPAIRASGALLAAASGRAELRRLVAANGLSRYKWDPDDADSESPITKLANALIQQAIADNCFTFRLEPKEKYLAVLFCDAFGEREGLSVPMNLVDPLIARFKHMAELDVNRQAAQRGMIEVRNSGIDWNATVITSPKGKGEMLEVHLHRVDAHGASTEPPGNKTSREAGPDLMRHREEVPGAQMGSVLADTLQEGVEALRSPSPAGPVTCLTEIPFEALRALTPELARKGVLPTAKTHSMMWVAVAPNIGESAIDEARKASGSDILGREKLDQDTFNALVARYYGSNLGSTTNSLALSFQPSQSAFLKSYGEEAEGYEIWAQMMDLELQCCGEMFLCTGMRSSLKCRLLLYSNPFLAWLHHREVLSGPTGDRVMALCERALRVAPNEAAKGVTIFLRSAVEFVRIAEQAHREYAEGRAEGAIGKLSLTRQIFDDLEKVAKKTYERIGGSLADIDRCRVAKEHVEKVIVRIRKYGDRQLGYLPSFEMLTHPKFMPHDQAGWWLINRWANE